MKLRYQLRDHHRNTPDEELLEDLRAVAKKLPAGALTQKAYSANGGRFAPTTISRRFGTWNIALDRAGLKTAWRVNTPIEEWFENIANVWNHYGRQPTYNDMDEPPSTHSANGYAHRFGGWRNALEQFVAFMHGTSEVAALTTMNVEASPSSRRSPRAPSWRLRFIVMERDGFRCQACGASPAQSAGVELHVDHVIPWSRGGTTNEDNLRTLCMQCNLGKSNRLPRSTS